MIKKAQVYYADQQAGYLTETDEGYEFAYTEEYAASSNPKPVSLTLPVKREPYKSKVLFPFFDGLIPEGWLLDIAVGHWKIKPNDRFQILLAACRDTIGAVSIIPEV